MRTSTGDELIACTTCRLDKSIRDIVYIISSGNNCLDGLDKLRGVPVHFMDVERNKSSWKFVP